MKRVVIILFLVIMLSALMFTPVFGEGDKVRGEKGQGCVNQAQIENEKSLP
jgi:hypothetical protein